MHEQYLGNNSQSALKVARKFFSDTSSFRVINDGQENLVIVADDSYVLRFPRSEEIWQRGIVERRVLERLSNKSDLPAPKLIAVSHEPAFLVVSYLHGQQLLSQQLRSMPTLTLEAIGRNIATFAFELHKSLSIEEFGPLIQSPSWSYDEYLRRELFEKTNENSRVDALAKEYYQKWQTRIVGKHKIVVHDDLHMGNLLFTDSFAISGVLDFGAVCIGTAEQELRQTYRLGEAGFEAAVATYETLSGQPFDREMAKLWTITQELATYCRQDTEAVYGRARENLCFWFPEAFASQPS